jgi:hypothetical protein
MTYPDDLNSENREAATTLDRVWNATRPPEPPAGSWDRVWGHVAAGLQQAAPETIPLSRNLSASRRPWAWIALAGFAQAAAVLAAGVIFLQLRGTAQPVAAPTVVSVDAPPTAPVLEFELNEGETLIVQVGERADHLVIRPNLVDTASLMVADLEDSPTDPYADAIALNMDILNVMEAIDETATVVDTPAADRERGRQSTSL